MLRMADGPVGNLPPGMDAYAGYVNTSGIGAPTYEAIVTRYPNARHLSITTDGSKAMCADVETGAMATWTGYTVGYCEMSRAGELVRYTGHPPKLWVAHYTNIAHICTPAACDPTGAFGLAAAGTIDGTQWTTHGNVYDESLLANDFFSFLEPPPGVAMNFDTLTTPDGNQQLFQVDGNGNLTHRFWTAAAGWSAQPTPITGTTSGWSVTWPLQCDFGPSGVYQCWGLLNGKASVVWWNSQTAQWTVTTP